MAVESTFGGYDFEFVRAVSERYKCQICTKVLRKPHLAVCCGQHYCETCLKEWLKQQRAGKQNCPHCRADGDRFNHVLNKGLRSEINQLVVKCSNHQAGCKWTGEIGDVETHLKGCGYVAIVCSNGCKDRLDKPIAVCKKDLKKHLDFECDLRPFQCEYCGYKDTYTAVTGKVYGRKYNHGFFGGHQSTCLEIPLTCPNECGTGPMKRREMEIHRSKCPVEPIECPFAECGCKDKFKRFQLEAHLNVSQQQHLLMVMKNYRETKNELHEVKGTLTNTLQVLKQVKDANKDVIDFLITRSTTLNKCGDSVRLVMPRFAEYRRSGKVWHSPPFYYREGYKMCLAVYANGVGYGAGTHLSVSLLLLCGKQLNEQQKSHAKKPCATHTAPYVAEGQEWFNVCAYQPLSQYSEAITELIHKEKFCSQKSSVLQLVNDCLAFHVTYANDCCLAVSVRYT